MRKLFVFILMLRCSYAGAQINVGSSAISTMNKAGKLSEDDINDLKQTTTLFTLQYRDYDHLQEFEKAIGEVWKITKFRIIKPDELSQYAGKEGYSFYTFGGFYRVTSHGPAKMNEHPTFQHLTYDLWIPDINKKGKVKGNNYYSRTILSPDAKVFEHAVENYGRHFSDKMMSYLYNEAVFYNWGAGFLKGYLETVNDLLAAQETRGSFTSDEDDDALAKLKRDTLYIPDYINVRYSPFSGEETAPDNEKEDERGLNAAYPHPMKLVTASQLNEMLQNRTTPFYYLVYVRSAADKFVDVYRSDKGLVYSRYTPMSYNFKNKDLGYISRALE